MLFNQEVTDHHCAQIQIELRNGHTFGVTCLNWLSKYSSNADTRLSWQWVGQQLVMGGWLTVDADNNFVPKE